MHCTQCGKEINEGEICSCQTQAPPAPQPVTLPIAPPAKKSNKKLMIVAALAVAIVVVAIIGMALMNNNSGNTGKKASEILLTGSELGTGWTVSTESANTYGIGATGYTDTATGGYTNGTSTLSIVLFKFQNTASAQSVFKQAKDQFEYQVNSAGVGDDSLYFGVYSINVIYFVKDNVVGSIVGIGISYSDVIAYGQLMCNKI